MRWTTASNDYYRLTLSRRSSFNLSLTGMSANVDVQLLNVRGDVVHSSSNSGTLADTLNLSSLSAGTYYIRVFANGLTETTPYQLSVQAQRGSQSNDLIWRHRTTGQNAIWQLNGVSQSTAVVLPTVADANWQIVGISDFNSDGQDDLLWRNAASGQNVIWQMTGMTYQSVVSLPTTPNLSWRVEATTDFNGDGHTDILWWNQASGQTVVWQMNGTSLSTVHSLP